MLYEDILGQLVGKGRF